MDKFIKYILEEEDKKATEKDVKDNKSNDDTKQVATADDKNKKVIDKSIPQRNMKEIFQKIVPFIKIYSPNSFRTARELNAGYMQLIFGGSWARIESNVLFDMLSTKFQDEFDIQKSRLDSGSQTVTLSIY